MRGGFEGIELAPFIVLYNRLLYYKLVNVKPVQSVLRVPIKVKYFQEQYP